MKNQLFDDVHNSIENKLKPERVQTKLKPERVQTKLKPERVQFTVNGKAVDHTEIVFLVNGRKLKPERVQFAVSIEKLKPERVQQAFAKVAEAFRYAKRGRLRKALQAFNKGMELFAEFLDDVWFSLIPSIDIALAESDEP